MPYRLIKSIDGRRGGFLTLVGMAWLIIGMVNLATPSSRSVDLAFSWVHFGGAAELAWVWMLGGLLALLIGLTSASRPRLETLGFLCILLPPVGWGFIFCVSTLFGNPYGLRGGVIYLAVAGILLYTSGWANPVVLQGEKTNGPA